MYKILNSHGLGVSGRQNELIELALTYKFNGVEVDMEDLVGRHDTLGKQFACQFLQSANIDVGTFLLPIELGVSNDDFSQYQKKLETICDLGETLGAKRCYIALEPTSEKFAFQENFEQHRSRIHDLGEQFEKHGMAIGLALQSAKAQASTGDYKFIQTAEELLTMAKTVGHKNVGVCLDTWEWVVGGGAMDQLADLDVNSITELRLADVSDDANLSAIKSSDRVAPGDGADSVSLKIVNHLLDNGFEGPFAMAPDVSMYAGKPRDSVVSAHSIRLDRLIARESLVDPVEADAEEGAGEEAGVEAAAPAT